METAIVRSNEKDKRHELYIDGRLMAYVINAQVRNPKKLLASMAEEKGYKVVFEDEPGQDK